MMEIINANISADLSECAIEHGLLTLTPKDLDKVFLLIADNISFNTIYRIIYPRFKDAKAVNTFKIPTSNVDTSNVLEEDSWMLIDHESKKIYYNEGA